MRAASAAPRWWALLGAGLGVALAAVGGAALFGGDDTTAPPLQMTPVGPPANAGQGDPGQGGPGQAGQGGAGQGDAGQGGAGQGNEDGQGAAGDEAVLIGVWRGETVDIVGNQAIVETVLMENGTFSQTQQSQGGQFYNAGTWRIVEPGTLRFAIEEYYPTEFCGPLGCTNITMPSGSTAFYRVLDPDTIEVRDSNGVTTVFQRVPMPG